MKVAYHNSWYAQINLQELNDCLSYRFGGDDFLEHPFFPGFEQFKEFQTDFQASGFTQLESESQIRSVELKEFSDPKAWPYIYKVWVSILLNSFPFVVAVGTSILSPAGRELIEEFNTTSELTVLTTSLFMLVGDSSRQLTE